METRMEGRQAGRKDKRVRFRRKSERKKREPG